MLPMKPHTVTVTQPVPQLGGNRVKASGETPAETVRGLMLPSNPTTAYERFGVEIQEPHEFFCDSGDGSKFAVGGTVRYSSSTFTVRAKQVYDTGLATDHARILLEKVV